jgi:U3 small nucleolar RNA-associated protein 14
MPVESESEEELESELEALMDDDSDGEEEVDMKPIESLIDSLDQTTQNKKRKRMQEINEAFDESEFSLAAKVGNDTKKIALDDLVSVVAQETNLGKLKKQLSALDNDANTATVGAPLALRSQERLNREVAYDESKKSISKWIPLVKKNREADQLLFPMNEQKSNVATSNLLVRKFVPTTSMEEEINNTLIAAGLTEEKQKETEDLELNKISPEEMQARRAQLAKMRSLMFFQEQKQKKIAKIKSKTYRKLKNKDAEKAKAEFTAELHKLDPELAQEEKDKADFERAKERMTLKHKNTGKWYLKLRLGLNRCSAGTAKVICRSVQSQSSSENTSS